MIIFTIRLIHSNTTNVKVKQEHYKGKTPEYIDSNTTNVKVKHKEIYAQGTDDDEFKYNQC